MSEVIEFEPAQSRENEKNGELASIAEVADQFGVTPRTLRFYEERGILAPIRRGLTRYYDAVQKRRVQMTVKARRLGFTLAEIAEMVEASDQSGKPVNAAFHLDQDTIERQLRHLEDRRVEIENAIAELRAKLLRPAKREN